MSNTILVLGHDMDLRLMLERHLTKQGFEVQLVHHGEEALGLASSAPPD